MLTLRNEVSRQVNQLSMAFKEEQRHVKRMMMARDEILRQQEQLLTEWDDVGDRDEGRIALYRNQGQLDQLAIELKKKKTHILIGDGDGCKQRHMKQFQMEYKEENRYVDNEDLHWHAFFDNNISLCTDKDMEENLTAKM